ncbi:hypothetical protein ACIQBJ_08965 [Kitasatospora sp. NPDC088391]|uniref:hypothetical protein n=1 Tax=Kitasatospora sp. NPDC088391 TaxID=3364074 RepID=UPI00382EBDD5
MSVTRVSKLLSLSAAAFAALALFAAPAEFAGNVADGPAPTATVTAGPSSTPAPVVQLGGDVTWGG